MLMLAVLVWFQVVVWGGKMDLQVGSEESEIFFNATKRHMLVTHTLRLRERDVSISITNVGTKVRLTIHLERKSR